MHPTTIAAIVLLVVGLVLLVYGGVTFTTHEKVAELGPVKVEREEEHRLPILPILGGVAAVGGLAMLLLSRRGRPAV